MCFCCYEGYPVGCNRLEREALLQFKADLQDPSGRLSSWVNGSTDCCKWRGVVCDNVTGYVTKLYLRCPGLCFLGFALREFELRGKLNPSLLELKHLSYLDLSGNDFIGSPIPRFLGSMTSLKSLSLNGCRFQGVIPHQLGNLSNLVELDLQATRGYYLLYADSLQWLSGLPALEYLGLSGVDLSNASDWLNMINAVPSLSKLYLANCHINGDFPLVHVNLSSLAVLDLGHNRFGPTSFPRWVSHLKRLTSLDLQMNDLRGPVPDELRNLTSLRALRLSWNMFIEGGIPASFRSFCQLKSLLLSCIKLQQNVSELLQILEECSSNTLETLHLDHCQLFGKLTDQIGKFKRLKRLKLQDNSISGPLPMSFGELVSLNHANLARNQIKGTIPASFGRLSELEFADISHNSMDGIVSSKIHFSNLTKLSNFQAGGNQIMFKAKPDWVPPKRLATLDLSSWYVGPGFPKWIQSIQYLKSLDLANSGIAEPIPDWFWSSHPVFYYLNLSHNQISGMLPSYISVISANSMYDFSWNKFEGPLPVISSNLSALDLSNNFLSGNLVKSYSTILNYVRSLDLSWNNFSGEIPKQITSLAALNYLNLSHNSLSGEIPECWRSWTSLTVVRLGSNKLRGNIPKSIGTLSSLLSLRIQNNYLTGEIPLSLGNCSTLVSIDLADNELEGNIPTWIGERLSRLAIMNLRGNNFTGEIPHELCHLQLLQILDISHNFLSGNLPGCVTNFSAMANSSKEDQAKAFVEYQVLVAQGQVKAYSTILNYVRSLDLSWNNFSGEIPKQMTSLVALHYLNLSHNSLSGSIPENLDAMESLESLDISENQLSGAIPSGMASLTFLNHLNLSYNNLSGRIPSSTQLQSFDPSSFVGNKGLCGSPLNASCIGTNLVPASGEGNGDYDYDLHWYTVSVMFGFVFGFWGIVGPLVVSTQLRKLCFVVLDRMVEKLLNLVMSGARLQY
ncbi:Receptor-like protein EIX2 [Linum grandiflorum]